MSWNVLGIGEYFTGKITILKLDREYELNSEKIYVYKTTEDSYLPFIHHKHNNLEIGKTYEIKGYNTEDKIRIVDIQKLD